MQNSSLTDLSETSATYPYVPMFVTEWNLTAHDSLPFKGADGKGPRNTIGLRLSSGNN